MINPLTRCVQEYAAPPYATLRASDIAPALRAAIDELTLDLNSIEDDLEDAEADLLTWEAVMDRLEIIDDPLDRLWRVVNHLCSVMNSAELRAAQAELQKEVLEIQNRRAQSPIMFRAITALRANATQWKDYTLEQQRIITRAIQAATLSGVALVDKTRFNAIHLRLTQLTSAFTNNLLDSVKHWSLIVHDKRQLDGLPTSTLARCAQVRPNSLPCNAVADGGATPTDGPWKLSLDPSVFASVLKYCTNRGIRAQIWHAYVTKTAISPCDNMPIIAEMLELRHEKAKLLGFSSFAELSLASKMAPSVATVDTLVASLQSKALPVARKELAALQAFALVHGQSDPIESYDSFYWAEKMRQTNYQLDDEALKLYFPLPRVLAGLFSLVERLFGVHIEAANDGKEAETWHPDVLVFNMVARDDDEPVVLAQFFLDLFSRPGLKKHNCWIDVAASRSQVLAYPVRIPLFCLMADLSPPVDATSPCLLSFTDVQNVFTSVGFGLRIALTAANYTASSRATGVEWDIVNVPGDFLAQFCFDRATMRMVSGHVETGETLPDAMFDQLVAARRFRAATALLGQLRRAALDMELYHRYDPSSPGKETLAQVYHRISSEFTVVPLMADDRHFCSLQHTFAGDYAAGYYSYMWSEMLATDAYAAFDEAPSMEEWTALGRRYKETMMALVGTMDPADVFERFRGRQPDPDALLKHHGLLHP
ncbi:Aste57867_8645 [Aphanomyces stellatus]|uniref:oligopeptidase A n=1 Tax=Aphanomyces stellatus TaxID=120398 RepID=A0A485KKY3_9STRA|nr:hypothetical protein As57867_008611 [Aphanomyces stellatus]VFT85531.1 Aste57867_8645 [Aphanomyces stellatus]